jgi:hypothetical protein
MVQGEKVSERVSARFNRVMGEKTPRKEKSR